MSDFQTISRLIDKIDQGLPQIKIRSITSLHTKVTLSIIDPSLLMKFKNLPGVLLTWINDNSNRTELLLKVLQIFQIYSQNQEGLVLLQQYEALQFFEELRKFLLGQSHRPDQYTQILESIIRALLPLQSQVQRSHLSSESKIEQKRQIEDDRPQKEQKKQMREQEMKEKEAVVLQWQVIRDPLGKKQEDQLYTLFMELRHSKKGLQLELLSSINTLMRYWGGKYFRFKLDLLSQLMDQYPNSNFKWLIIEIFRSTLRTANTNAQQLKRGKGHLIALQQSRPVVKPQSYILSLTVKNELFENIFSYGLLDDILSYSLEFQQKQKQRLHEWLLYLPFKNSSKYFTTALSRLINSNHRPQLHLSALNRQIQFYCLHYPACQSLITSLINSIPPSWQVTPDDFPSLMGYLRQSQQLKSYNHISKYDEEWQLGNHLHQANQTVAALEKGIEGITCHHKTRQYVQLYLRCLMTLGAAVERQDPLMTLYPKMKALILQIANNDQSRTVLFEQILSFVNSHSQIKYGNKNYLCSELALMVFSQDHLFSSLFQQSLKQDQNCGCWLQVTKRLILTNNLQNIDDYSPLFYVLGYSSNQQVRQCSKFILQRVAKKGKATLLLVRLFSQSQEERTQIAKQIAKNNYQSILEVLNTHNGSPQGQEKSKVAKKQLKIGIDTLQNYIKIILSPQLEQHIQMSAAEQLLQSVQRVQLTEPVVGLLLQVQEDLAAILSQNYQKIPVNLLEAIIALREEIGARTKHQKQLQLGSLLALLQRVTSQKGCLTVLKEIYRFCFRSPFANLSNNDQSKQYSLSIFGKYPHIKLISMPVSPVQSQPQSTAKPSSTIQQLPPLPHSLSQWQPPSLKQPLIQLLTTIEAIIHLTINGQKVKLSHTFTDLLQKQLGQVIQVSKGFASLHLLNHLFTFIIQHKITVPQRAADYSSPLLCSMLAKELPQVHAEVVAQLLASIGSRRTRQVNNLLANGPNGTWKLFLINKAENVDGEVVNTIVKNLLGVNYGRDAALMLHSLAPLIARVQLNQFSQNLIVSSCLKFFRQQSDPFLRKLSLTFLSSLHSTSNLPSSGQTDLFASLTAVMTEQLLPSDLMAQSLSYAKKILLNDGGKTLQQGSVVKLLVGKLMPLVGGIQVQGVLLASVLELLRAVLAAGKVELLAGADTADLVLPFLHLAQKNQQLTHEQLLLLSAAIDILYLSCQQETQLPKYLLASTRTQNQLLAILSTLSPTQTSNDSLIVKALLQSVARLWILLSVREQDFFVYKLSQIVNSTQIDFMEVLSGHAEKGGSEYLKMLGWTVVIWTRNRQSLSSRCEQLLSTAMINSRQPEQLKRLLPFSLRAKNLFLNSSILTDSLKEALNIVDSRIVKQTKEKRKKTKTQHQLNQHESAVFQEVFQLLSALFYWESQSQSQQIQGGQGLKKAVSFIERFYLAGTWQQSITKMFLRTSTNMALAQPLSDSLAVRLSQNPSFIEQIASSITKSEHIDPSSRIALRLAASLLHIESVRAHLLRNRLLEEVSGRLIRGQQRDQLNLQYTMEAVELFLAFSVHKDANTRILNDKKLAQLLVKLLGSGKLSLLEQKIAKLLANLACYKHNKPTLMSCKHLHKTILGLLEDPDTTYRPTLLSLLYNLLYKNSQALKLYRRPQVLTLLKGIITEDNEVGRALLDALEGDDQ